MWLYNWRDLISWGILAGLVVVTLYLGSSLFNGGQILKVAVTESDPISQELALTIKKQVEINSNYKIAIENMKSAKESQRALLEGRVDLAIVMPAVLNQAKYVRGLLPLAEIYSHFIVRRESNLRYFEQFPQFAIATGATDSDQSELSHKLMATVQMSPGMLDSSGTDAITQLVQDKTVAGAILSTHPLDKRLQTLLHSNEYGVVPVSAQAMALNNPMVMPTELPGRIYKGDVVDLPPQNIETLKTFTALVGLQDLPQKIVFDLLSILKSTEAQLELSVYGGANIAATPLWAVYPKHDAVIRFNDEEYISHVAAKWMSWLITYKWFVLAALSLGLYLYYMATQYRTVVLERRTALAKADIEHLINQTLRLEKNLENYHDLQQIKDVLADVLDIKEKGLHYLLQNAALGSNFNYLFIEQCHYLIQKIEARIEQSYLRSPMSRMPPATQTQSPYSAIDPVPLEPSPLSAVPTSSDVYRAA